MLRLTVSTEEYLMIGDDIKLVFLGGTGKHLRIMVDAPKDKNILRSTVLEKDIKDPKKRANLPKYYAQVEHPEKYVKKPRQEADEDRAGVSRTKPIGTEADRTEAIRTENTGKQGTIRGNSRIIIARGNMKNGRG